jgi:hypothetical protein
MVKAYFDKKKNADRNYNKYKKKGYDMRKGTIKIGGKKRYYIEVRK